MTNSRITDPEILEANFPVLLQRFSIERIVVEKGKYIGGNGVTRNYISRANGSLNSF